MDPRELAGREGGKGKSAEFLFRARERDGFPGLPGQVWAGGGSVGNTHGTVRGIFRGGAIRLQGTPLFAWVQRCERAVGRGVSLPTFLLLQPTDKKKDGGHSHEI